MKQWNFLKSVGAAMTMAAASTAIVFSLLAAPTATAETQFFYRMKVDDGLGEIVSQGNVEVSSDQSLPPVSDSLGESVQFDLRAQDCEQSTLKNCSPGHVYLEISIWSSSQDGTRDKTVTTLIVQNGEVGGFMSTLQDGQRLSGMFGPKTTS